MYCVIVRVSVVLKRTVLFRTTLTWTITQYELFNDMLGQYNRISPHRQGDLKLFLNNFFSNTIQNVGNKKYEVARDV